MAISEIYVDPALAGDTGRGTRMTATLSAATFTFAGLTLNETNAFTAYNALGWVSGDRIYLTGGTAVTVGWHEIASVSSNSEIVMVADITTDSSSPTNVTSDSAPYGDLEYAIEQTTFDTTNGTRVNVKAGTDEIVAVELGAALASASPTAAWVGNRLAPIIFQGYTTAAGDGGKGGISGGGTVSIINGSVQWIHFIDMHLHNCGSLPIVSVGSSCRLINSEFNNATSSRGVNLLGASVVIGCHFHDIAGIGVEIDSGIVMHCHFANGTKDFVKAISVSTNNIQVIYRNTIHVDGASIGIVYGNYTTILNNSIFSAAGTGQGLSPGGNSFSALLIANNLVEGFSGAGGVGITGANTGTVFEVYGGNALYDNTTEYIAPLGYVGYELGGAASNETLSASPFTDATNDDFSPVDTGNVKEGALPPDFGDGAI